MAVRDDLRGEHRTGAGIAGTREMSPFTQRVIANLRRIPSGCVSTYGVIAGLAGNVRSARAVAWILSSLSKKMELPWHRVVGACGRISLSGAQGRRQARLLRTEGVAISGQNDVDLARYGWPREKFSRRHKEHAHSKPRAKRKE